LMKSLALVAGAKQQLLTGANAFLQGAGLQPLTMEQFNLAIADPNSELMVMLNQVVGAKQQMLDGVNAFLGGAGQQPLTMEQFNEAISHPDTGLMLQLKQVLGAKEQLLLGANAFLKQSGKAELTEEQFDTARLDPTSELMTLLKGTIDQATTARQQLFAGANGFLTQIGKPALTIEQFDTAIVDPTSELMTLLAQYSQADPSIKGLYDGIKSLPPKAQIESLTILYNGILSLPTNEAVAGLQNLYNGLGVLPAQSQIDSLNTLYSSIKLLPPNEQLVGLQNLYNGILSLPTDTEIDGLKALLDGINSLTPDVDDVKLLYFGVQSLASALKEVRPMFIGKQHSRIILQLDLAEEGDATFLALDELKVIANAEYKDNNYFYGLSQVAYDIKEVVEVDYIVVTVISIIAIFLMIMIPFKSLSIPVILLFVIELGIFINMAIPFFAGITLSYISYLIISAIELGCTIDYAILMVGKYIDYRKSLPPKESAIESVNSSAASILTSGGILTIVGLLINLISSNQLISETGGMLWRAGVLSMLFVFFLLPGLFVIFDRFVIRVKKSKHKKALQTPDVSSDEYIIPSQTSIDKSKEEVEPQSQNVTNKRKK
ncbi:MAG: MMPL family transporter, partial [Clostridia bacterium]